MTQARAALRRSRSGARSCSFLRVGSRRLEINAAQALEVRAQLRHFRPETLGFGLPLVRFAPCLLAGTLHASDLGFGGEQALERGLHRTRAGRVYVIRR